MVARNTEFPFVGQPMKFLVNFSSLETGGLLGCCIVEALDQSQVPYMAHRLGLEPGAGLLGRATLLTEEQFAKQGMEANRLYGRDELLHMGFEMELIEF